MLKTRQITNVIDDDVDGDYVDDEPLMINRDDNHNHATTCCVQKHESPNFDTFHGHQTIRITIDTGVTGNMIRLSSARCIALSIRESSESAY